MEALAWNWCVVASVQADATVELSVEAGGRRLLPVGHALPPLEAMPCLLSVLTPFAPDDAITIEVRTPERTTRKWTGHDVDAAIKWLAEALPQACDYRKSPEPVIPKTTTGVHTRPMRTVSGIGNVRGG